MWQDYVFTAGAIVFAIGLVPTLRTRSFPSQSTCFITAGVMAAYCVANATLDLTLTALTVGFNGFLWMYMALAQLKQ